MTRMKMTKRKGLEEAGEEERKERERRKMRDRRERKTTVWFVRKIPRLYPEVRYTLGQEIHHHTTRHLQETGPG